MGAEITGVDLAALSADDLGEIRQAFHDHQVLVFRAQNLDREAHKAFGRCFGELHIHPSKKQLDTKTDPEIFAIKTTPDSPWTNGEAWHSDVSCEPIPPLGSMLYVR
ncbi:MAG: TauD/TfdA family dioxygenase, partial [Pseudomonadota bacterium]